MSHFEDQAYDDENDVKDVENSRKQLISSLFGDDDSDDEMILEDSNASRKDETREMVIEERQAPPETSPTAEETSNFVSNVLDIKVNNFPTLPKDAEIMTAKIPTARMLFQHVPFNREQYDGKDIEMKKYEDEHGNVKYVLPPDDVIRWRWVINDKGERVKQSNAKFVRWSDGSLHLYVGKYRYIVETRSMDYPNEIMVRQSDSVFQSHGSVVDKITLESPQEKVASRNYAYLQTKKKEAKLNDITEILDDVDTGKLREQGSKIYSMQDKRSRESRRQSYGYQELSEDFLEEGLNSNVRRRSVDTEESERRKSKALLDAKQRREEEEDDDFIAPDDEDLEEGSYESENLDDDE